MIMYGIRMYVRYSIGCEDVVTRMGDWVIALNNTSGVRIFDFRLRYFGSNSHDVMNFPSVKNSVKSLPT